MRLGRAALAIDLLKEFRSVIAAYQERKQETLIHPVLERQLARLRFFLQLSN